MRFKVIDMRDSCRVNTQPIHPRRPLASRSGFRLHVAHAVHATRGSAASGGGYCGKNVEHETVRRDGSDEALADHAVPIDDVGLRYSVYAPIDAGTPLAIIADARIGIADIGQKGPCLCPRIL